MHSCVGLRYSPRALLDECGMAQSQGPQLDVKMALADLCEARPASFVALLSVRASVCALAGLEEKTTHLGSGSGSGLACALVGIEEKTTHPTVYTA